MTWKYQGMLNQRMITDNVSGGIKFYVWYDLRALPEGSQGISHRDNPRFPFEYVEPYFLLRSSGYSLRLDDNGILRQALTKLKRRVGKNIITFPKIIDIGKGSQRDLMEMGKYADERIPKIAEEIVSNTPAAACIENVDWRNVEHMVMERFCELYDGLRLV